MSTLKLHPLNDLAFVATLKTMGASGALAPLESGAVTAFLATDDAPTATAADSTLVSTPIYTGSGGKWSVRFPASALQPTLLATLFATATPYCILQADGGIRAAIALLYEPVNLVVAT